ncbi:hypothetical protein AGABI1DRAFT_73024 [Agaricus bisporus var. burnettii JB137-S8]|uniref:Gfd2/YDR514C-like C-terminal domain-containing protein n=1 Tax=Agaricus bisporus var. burnettii (strain JB137-S8 / ATCC MYA-4627 / FGSC 10392) TaxID=597362 RepID=K5W047_AGABU|nr:uncharacterized protein AGABI1DRAFT_73024 [Agaricus bisporus var. burnettii JB137-S8]EKM80129.1 hypothetical protein AGABI1DRAFT_73024 [Agaricus bisporus var. burnettii JB137-S8]
MTGGKPNEILTGYYRYTDIWFDWHRAIPDEEDGTVLKAILAHDSLADPSHPLHIDGITGIQLYHVTFETSGETRLCFSSAQIDYVRYWLHAMKLTKTLLPIPYSDCLIVTSDIKHVSTHTYQDGGSLRSAIKNLEKHSKRLKGSNPALLSRRHTFERVRQLVAAKNGTWCAIDFEAWEYEHTLITEVGYSILRWDKETGEEIRENGHWVVQGTKQYENYRYVPGNRNNYNFGESKEILKKDLKPHIAGLINRLRKDGPLYLVFHDNNQDIKYMKSPAINAPLDELDYLLPDTSPTFGLFVVDTSDLFGALMGLSTGQRRGLQKTCRMLHISTSFLHNAGNDAYYTLEAMIQMAQGENIDEQREKRWPNRTAPGGLEVEMKPWEEDSEYDEEDEMGPNVRNTTA